MVGSLPPISSGYFEVDGIFKNTINEIVSKKKVIHDLNQIINFQKKIGIAIPSDGELLRWHPITDSGDNYLYAYAHKIGAKSSQENSYKLEKAVFKRNMNGCSIVEEYLFYKLLMTNIDIIKINLPGPFALVSYLFGNTVFNLSDIELKKCLIIISNALHDDIKSLADLGFKNIQIDDPYLFFYGHNLQVNSLTKVELYKILVKDFSDLVITLHVCFGNPYKLANQAKTIAQSTYYYYLNVLFGLHGIFNRLSVDICTVEEPLFLNELETPLVLGIADACHINNNKLYVLAKKIEIAERHLDSISMYSSGCGLKHLTWKQVNSMYGQISGALKMVDGCEPVLNFREFTKVKFCQNRFSTKFQNCKNEFSGIVFFNHICNTGGEQFLKGFELAHRIDENGDSNSLALGGDPKVGPLDPSVCFNGSGNWWENKVDITNFFNDRFKAGMRMFMKGHLLTGLEKICPTNFSLSILLRDPRKRLFSEFKWNAAKINMSVDDLVINFEKFLLKNQRISHYCNMLLTPALELKVIDAHYVPDNELNLSDEYLINLTLEELSRYDFVGITEYFSESLAMFALKYKITNIFRSYSGPVDPYGLEFKVLPERVVSLLESCVRCDYAVYEYQRTRFISTVKDFEHNIKFNELNSYFDLDDIMHKKIVNLSHLK